MASMDFKPECVGINRFRIAYGRRTFEGSHDECVDWCLKRAVIAEDKARKLRSAMGELVRMTR